MFLIIYTKNTKIDHLYLCNTSYLGYKLSFYYMLFWGVEYPFNHKKKFDLTEPTSISSLERTESIFAYLHSRKRPCHQPESIYYQQEGYHAH